MNATPLVIAASQAHYAGRLTAEQRNQFVAFVEQLTATQQMELAKALAIDWQTLLGGLLPKLLPLIVGLIPGLAPFAGIIGEILPFLQDLLNGGASVPDGGVPRPA